MPFGTFVTCLTQGRRNGRCCTYRPIHRACHFNSLLCHTRWTYPSRSGLPSGPQISVPRQCPWENPSDGSPMTRADGTALLLHLHRPLIRFTLVHHATSPAASPCMTEVRIKVWLHTESMVQPTAASFIERRLEQFFKLMHKLQVRNVPSTLFLTITMLPRNGWSIPPPQPPCSPCLNYLAG
ncbi:hypothetical protein BDP81DRAFT_183959 [Colletotrichum phormii]|uniref:Uncharacterized protein n=1 Tax=Colletotrichum phormii TaxID=359342 RepID=A0AAJ0EI04_9PEZI|nr:uncharacterized protein BDP81DRAFT_183959 [Colletotrichum phormii]KAK1639803.1 hypothetical protein BDP81DRAFT_183959 [Colletotrichum phormii]